MLAVSYTSMCMRALSNRFQSEEQGQREDGEVPNKIAAAPALDVV